MDSSATQTPEWVRDAVFYQIFPDRFAASRLVRKPSGLDAWGSPPTWHNYMGGDLIGVVERLDYLCDLGVNALYFTPIFQSASNHRYHTHDYWKVDPMLGGDAALRLLLDEVHRRGMKVVLDGVFNHASRGFFQFHDILENGPNSAYLDWFTVSGFPLNAYDAEKAPAYHAWWGLRTLPKFNIQTPAVRAFLLEVARHWVEFGIDGWRLDVANEIDDDDFWRAFRDAVRGPNPDAYIVGEVWSDATHWVNKGDMWDAVMNYLFTRACMPFFIGPDADQDVLRTTSLHPLGPSDAATFRANIEALLKLYPRNVTQVMLNLLGSHDVARFTTVARGDTSALRLATLFQMTYPGAPLIYYGDELGMTGGHDPANRGAFPWHRPETWDVDLLHHVQRMTALRHAHPSLRRGTFTILHAADDVFAYARRLDGEMMLIALNVSKSTRRLDLPVLDLVADGTVCDEVSARGGVVSSQGWVRDLELAPRSGRVFKATIAR